MNIIYVKHHGREFLMKSLHLVLCAAFVSALSAPAFGMQGQERLAMRETDASFFRPLTPSEKRMVGACEEGCAQGCALGCVLVNRDMSSSVCMGFWCGIAAGHIAGRTCIWLKEQKVKKNN